jgi:hypothetical protein
VATRLPVVCADLSPTGGQAALACEDGRVHLVEVDGMDQSPLVVTAARTTRRTQTTLEKLLGKSRVTHAYRGTCPACRQAFELPGADPSRPAACPHCGRGLKVNALPAAV